jgi:transcriptional regulator of acetoin/glycerol metabolism
MKTLISWMATVNDFDNGKVKKTGLNYTFHQYHYQHDRHILLATEDTETQVHFLVNDLRRDFPFHVIEPRFVAISDLGDLRETKILTESVLLSIANDEIDIFFLPGTSMMQLAWYICHTSLGLKTRLLQILRPEHSKHPKIPDLLEIKAEQSSVPYTAVLKQYKLDQPRLSEAYITPTLLPVYNKADKVAQTDNVTCLIYGESGSGKELLARYIHMNSARAAKPYKTINCSAFSDTLLESRLFGFKIGSFTGAVSSETGIFEEANHGTLFMDEIGDISPYMQQLLLRVLQEKEIQPIGKPSKKVNVRIIAATNRNLPELCQQGKFRWDLYYRLAVVELELPPLVAYTTNERKQFIAHFLKQKQRELRKPKLLSMDAQAESKLATYHYPGNLREMENIIENLYVFCSGEIKTEDLPKQIACPVQESVFDLKTVEKLHIEKVYRHFKGNKRQTALALGISINTLNAKLGEED